MIYKVTIAESMGFGLIQLLMALSRRRLTLVFPWWQRSQSIRKADASDFSVQGHDTASLLLNNTAGQHQTTGCFIAGVRFICRRTIHESQNCGFLWSYVFPCLSPVLPRLLPPRWWQVRWQTGRPFSAPLSTSFVPRWNDWEIPWLPWFTECWAGCWRDRPPLQMAHLRPENPERGVQMASLRRPNISNTVLSGNKLRGIRMAGLYKSIQGVGFAPEIRMPCSASWAFEKIQLRALPCCRILLGLVGDASWCRTYQVKP